jgi:peptidoglycan/xylan/chitin deacetylase (PgdA/CDA1 family)
MKGKRERLARWAQRLGFTFLLARAPKRKQLLVLNYHRVGKAEETPFDPRVFSATAEEFDEQLKFLRRHCRVISLEEAVGFAEGRGPDGPGGVLITFDDGYRDNYDVAFPLLRAHGLQATFFLSTGLVGGTDLPWWDQIAGIVKRAKRRRFRVRYPSPAEFDLDRTPLEDLLRRLARLYTLPETPDAERFLRELEGACDSPRPGRAEIRCFLNWEEARQMLAGGMAIGSHAHSHRLLSRLSPQEQYDELATSRRLLADKLGIAADVLAYPEGSRASFSAETRAAAARAGYRAAFSFYEGVNSPGRTDPYDIRRCGVCGESLARFCLRVALGTALGSCWP